jgi:hypothetical protein
VRRFFSVSVAAKPPVIWVPGFRSGFMRAISRGQRARRAVSLVSTYSPNTPAA